jgi:hypothetical protein
LVKQMSLSDFRAVRLVCERKDFVFAPGPESAPSDLISKKTWQSIITLPDDVSIRTSNYHGRVLRNLHELSGAWIDAVGDDEDMVFQTSIDALDEFDAVTFNALHGYYRQAIGCLRNVLELTTFGAYCQVCSKNLEFSRWLEGELQIRFGTACDGLLSVPAIQPLKSHLQNTLQDSLFAPRQEPNRGGWARRLHSDLSHYTHSRPGCTNVDLWQSNGPIYDQDSFILTESLFLETLTLCFLLVKIARPEFTLPTKAKWLFKPHRPSLPWDKIAIASYQFLFASKTV